MKTITIFNQTLHHHFIKIEHNCITVNLFNTIKHLNHYSEFLSKIKKINMIPF